MIVLGIDTAGDGCAVALWHDGAILARRAEARRHGHAEALLPMILGVMDEAGVTLGEVDLYGVTIGPGAFTGLRVGLAAAGGLALAGGRPIVGVTSLEAVAQGVPGPAWAGAVLLAALDSRRTDLFVQAFGRGEETGPPGTGPAGAPDPVPLGPPAAVAPEDLAAWLAAVAPARRVVVAGGAADRALAVLGGSEPGEPARLAPVGPCVDAGVVAALAAQRADRARPDPPAPLYLRPPGVSLAALPRRALP